MVDVGATDKDLAVPSVHVILYIYHDNLYELCRCYEKIIFDPW